MDCVYQCPGLAIFGYQLKTDKLFLPIEYKASEGAEVFLVNNNGEILGEGIIEKVLMKPNKTNIARVKSNTVHGEDLLNVRGFIVKENYPDKPQITSLEKKTESKTYICHCEDITVEKLL